MKFGKMIGMMALAACGRAQWDELTTLMNDAVSNQVFPGAVAMVFTEKDVLFQKAVGSFTYGVPPPATPDTVPQMTMDTIFDIASCSKVVAGTSAMALLHQWGAYNLDDTVSKYLPLFAQNGKDKVTIRQLMAHHAGLAADPSPGFATKDYGCPAMLESSPKLSFDCRDRWFNTIMEESLQAQPGTSYTYSDISLMTAMGIVGTIAKDKGYITKSDIASGCPIDNVGESQCYYEAFVRKYVVGGLGLKNTMFNPPKELWPRIAPSKNDTYYTKRQLQGEVHDPNTFAMGGISGHAGIFSTAEDMMTLARGWLFAPESSTNFLNKTTTSLWIKQVDKSVSSRALGWNTNTDEIGDRGWNHACGSLSPETFLHTGYTGTIICADPVRGVGTVILGMRVYPDDSHSAENKEFRKNFHTVVQKVFDSM